MKCPNCETTMVNAVGTNGRAFEHGRCPECGYEWMLHESARGFHFAFCFGLGAEPQGLAARPRSRRRRVAPNDNDCPQRSAADGAARAQGRCGSEGGAIGC